ncbi:hypothetical protein [Paracoccus xiamenensis]|uniref:hypothetical protein n=1 Tax=Paracoccus xiamenensis TaxID=2714901 RepID=UPI00140B703E|nr:hypothetical protein [Paracoccus xiamenensis]NHF73310.1 hypothetical protein [Paracoccus xiamenensis]
MSLEKKLNTSLEGLYRRTLKEARYNGSYFLKMLHERGGLAAAKALINKTDPSEGFARLWEIGRLDLTVEAFVLENPEFHSLFTSEELGKARKRLTDLKYTRKADEA